MSKKIIGITVGTQLPKPNFNQTDPTKGDYIRNKPDFDGLKSRVKDVEDALGSINLEVDTTLSIAGAAADANAVGDAIDQLSTLVGDTSVSQQITEAINDINGVPAPTTGDDGKFLRVVNGAATWASVPKAEEASF